ATKGEPFLQTRGANHESAPASRIGISDHHAIMDLPTSHERRSLLVWRRGVVARAVVGIAAGATRGASVGRPTWPAGSARLDPAGGSCRASGPSPARI